MFSFTLPTESEKTYYFRSASATDFMSWNKPMGISFVNILAIGGGGGGGPGTTAAAAAARGGGGGGGGAGMTSATFVSSLLPDTLFLRVGAGGAGGAPGSAGTAGGVSYVCLFPSTTYPIVYAPGGNGGGAASGTTAGAAATAASAATLLNMPLGGSGIYAFNAGVVGFIGGSGTVTAGTAATILSSGSLNSRNGWRK